MIDLPLLTWEGKLKVQVGIGDDEEFSFGQVVFEMLLRLDSYTVFLPFFKYLFLKHYKFIIHNASGTNYLLTWDLQGTVGNTVDNTMG